MKQEVIFETARETIKCDECGRRYTKRNPQGQQKKGVPIKFVCGRCIRKSKQVTNKWYDPKFDKRSKTFIGKFSLNSQEAALLIRKYQMKGCSYAEAKKKVAYDIKGMSQIKWRKKYEEADAKAKAKAGIEQSQAMKKKLVDGLTQ